MLSLDRRDFLRFAAASSAALFVPGKFASGQDSLLDEMESRAADFFLDHSDPKTGLVRDRARMAGPEARRIGSIAATGFGLSALCIADKRGYLPAAAAQKRAEHTVGFLLNRVCHKNGFFPHFLDLQTGARLWKSEYSSVDTAWLMCGALHAAAHFHSPNLSRMVNELYGRVDWRWMLNAGDTLSHGWTPEHGFLPYRWDQYSELLALYILAMGSPTHPIPAECWEAWSRPVRNFNGFSYIESSAPLFAHQYSHAWIDFRGTRDRFADYFENSCLATGAHRLFCIELSKKYPWINENMWGITASDSRRGYLAWGGPLRTGAIDGTLVPCAAGGSLAFMPQECLAVLETMLARYGNKAWGRYGFVDAFHPKAGWYDADVIAIDQGITMLMAENARTGLIWHTLAADPNLKRGMQHANLRA